MSYSNLLRSAATQAQAILAQMQGMEPGGTNTAFADGTTCVGTYGAPQVVEVPLADGGFRRRAEVTLTITRYQLSTVPSAQRSLTRTDLTPNVVYRIDSVDTHDALHYVLTLVRSGE